MEFMSEEKRGKLRKRVTLEPDLEAVAGGWAPALRLRMARLYMRWGHQLKLSAIIEIKAKNPSAPKPSLRPMPARRLRRN